MSRQYEKTHSRSVRAAVPIPAYRFVNRAGALGGVGVLGVSESAAPVGDDVALITGYSALVEAATPIAVGDIIDTDATGRAIGKPGGIGLGIAESPAMAGGLFEVRLGLIGVDPASVVSQPVKAEILLSSLSGGTTEQPLARIDVPAGSMERGGLYELRLLISQPTGSGGNKTVRVRVGGDSATEAPTTVSIGSSTNQSINAIVTLVIGSELDDVTVHAIATGMTSTGAPARPLVDFGAGATIWVTGQLANAADAIHLLACKLVCIA